MDRPDLINIGTQWNQKGQKRKGGRQKEEEEGEILY